MLKNQNKENEVTFQELKNLINFIDTDKNGKINYTQFIASALGDQVLSSKDNLRKVFSMLDKDGNGFIDREQLVGILSQHGFINSQTLQEEVNEIFAESDTNKDGKIDFDEFVGTVCKIVK